MKNLNGLLFFFGAIIVLCVSTLAAKESNRLNWVEISQTKISTQIMFDFANPVDCRPELIKETRNLMLAFPGMSLQNFDATHVQSQLSSLKTDGLIKTIAVTENNHTGKNVNLSLEFLASRDVKDAVTNQSHTKQNRFLIKWSVLEHPHRLIVDIFIKEDLDKLMKKDAVLLYATNDTQVCDTSIPNATLKKKSNLNAQTTVPRIILDPGHGGGNTGKKGHYKLLEKDITLDIARRVHAMLKKRGRQPLLIRTHDKDISLLDRIHLAHQLQGDLFVSIHANSAGKMDSDASGLETFYLDGQTLLPEHKKTGLACIDFDVDQSAINTLNDHMKTTLSQSKNLAEHIQNSVIKTLSQQNIPINNRGVKPEKFRVLLRTAGGSIPASLIEVGFLTNRAEAKKLATAPYRTIIAQGICDGICTYLDGL